MPTESTTETPKTLGQIAYEAANARFAGASPLDGETLPAWDQLNDLVKPGWEASALAIREHLAADERSSVPDCVKKAKAAIRHVLEQIRTNPSVGWYLGVGTQSFGLLTEAAAELFERPLEEVEKHFRPHAAADPCAQAHAKIRELMDDLRAKEVSRG